VISLELRGSWGGEASAMILRGEKVQIGEKKRDDDEGGL